MNLNLKNRNVLTLNTFDKVKRFVNIVNTYDYSIEAVQGKYIVDAKSIMGMFSLDLTKPVTIEIDSSKLEEIKEFNGKMREFI